MMTRLAKRLLLAASIVLALPLLVLGAVGLLLTPAGEHWLGEHLGGWLSSPERSVAVSGLHLRWPLDVRVERIEVADQGGPWLVLHGLALDWSPQQLLSGTFSASLAGVERAEIRRAPQPSSSPPSSSEQFTLPSLPLSLNVTRLAVGISASPEVTGTPLEMTASGHAGVGPSRLDVDLEMRRQGADGSDAHARLDYDRTAELLKVDLGLASPAARLLIQLAGVADQVPALDLRLSGQGPITDWRGSVSGKDDDRACLEGTLRLAHARDITIATDLAVAPDCLVDPAMVHLLSGAPIALHAEGIIKKGSLTHTEARLDSAVARVEVSGTVTKPLGLRFSMESAQLDRFGALAGMDAGGQLRVSGAITGSLAAPVVEADIQSAEGHFTSARWRDLASTARLTPMSGVGWLVTTAGSGFAVGLSPTDSPIRWSSNVQIDHAGTVYRLAELRVEGLDSQASLFGTVQSDGAMALRGMVRSGQLSTFGALIGQPKLRGRGLAHMALSGRPHGALAARIVMDLTKVTTGQTRLDTLLGGTPRLTASALYGGGALPMVRAEIVGDTARLGLKVKSDSGRDTAPTGSLRLNVNNDQISAALFSRFRLKQGLHLAGLSAFAGGSRLNGALTVANGGVTGHLTGRSDDLRSWSELLGVTLGGSLTVETRLNHTKGQAVEVTLSGTDLELAGTHLGRLGGRLDVTDALGEAKGMVRLEAAQLVRGGTVLRSLELRADGTAQGMTLAVDAAADQNRQPLTLSVRGHLIPKADLQTLRLDSLVLKSATLSGRLAAPTTLLHDDDSLRLSPIRFDLGGGGRMEASGKILGTAQDLRLALVKIPMTLIKPYLPDDSRVVGTLDTTIRIAGTSAAPDISVDAAGHGLGVEGAAREHLDLTVSARWRDRQVTAEAQAKGSHGSSAKLEASLPLLANLTIPEAGVIKGSLRGTSDLGLLMETMPLPGHRFAGKLEADLSISGTVAHPTVSGQGKLRDGFYEHYQTATQLRNLQASLTARDSQSFAVSLSGTDGRRKGRVSGEGKVELSGAQTSWDMALTLSDFAVVGLDTARARASGQLALTGQGESGQLAGKLEVGPSEFQVTKGLFGGGVPKLKVTELHRPATKPAPEQLPPPGQKKSSPPPPVTITLALDVDINQLFVRGQGLESDWRGHLTIGGTAHAPSVDGKIEAVHGSYDLIGKHFSLIDSQIIFDGGTMLIPTLDMTAEASANDITAQIKVTGSATKPELEFTSVPVLPGDEVLSRLLFGKSLGQLSVAQQLQLARAASSLAGESQFDPIGTARGALGLDMLDVGASDDGSGLSPNVTVGKYIDKDTFLRVEEGLGTNEGKVTIERRLGHGLSVEADVGRSGSGGVGLSWREDY